jgi:hypothetical protein
MRKTQLTVRGVLHQLEVFYGKQEPDSRRRFRPGDLSYLISTITSERKPLQTVSANFGVLNRRETGFN